MNKQERLNKLYKECINELKTTSIDVEKNRIIELKINTRSKKRYGCCKKISKDKFQIEVSEWVMDLNEDIIKNTIMHPISIKFFTALFFFCYHNFFYEF